ncbi:MAG: YetF domain-containing protein [Candidatus Omnitrophota bacterium]
MNIDWQEIFSLNVPLLEIILRGTVIYLFIFFFFRFIAVRVGGNLSLSDILVIVLIADAVQNGMAGEQESVTDALALVGTLMFWNLTIEVMTYYSPPLRKILMNSPLLVIKDGVMIRKNMRRQFVSDEELMSKLRQMNVHDLSAVKEAYIEEDGQISVKIDDRPAGDRKGRT